MNKVFAILFFISIVSQVSAFVAPTSVVSKAAFASAAHAPLSVFPPAVTETSVDVISQLPTQLLSLEVQFGAYLAVLLGVFVPVSFLLVLYIQSESRKAGEASKN